MQAPERRYGAVRVVQLIATSMALIGLLHGQNRAFDLLTAGVADIRLPSDQAPSRMNSSFAYI
jgi:hypothetical protein